MLCTVDEAIYLVPALPPTAPCTMNGSWVYKYYDCGRKPAEEILRIKNKLNGMGCNYLLNVGPDRLGRIPAPCVEILRKAGEEADLTNHELRIQD